MCSQRFGNLSLDIMYLTGQTLQTSSRLLKTATELVLVWDKATDHTGTFMTWKLLGNGPSHQIARRHQASMSGELTAWDMDAEVWGVFLVVFELPTGQPIAACRTARLQGVAGTE
jgi:hypothetical protein